MPANDPESLSERTKHPLVVLAVSTMIGSVLIPILAARSTHASRLRDLRVTHTMEAIRANANTDRNLNRLLTELNNYVKDEQDGKESSRVAFRRRFQDAYAEFERDAWWWYWSWLEELRVLRVVNGEERAAMTDAMKSYATNLDESAVLFALAWDISPRRNILPPPIEPSQVAAIADQLSALRARRNEILKQMLAPLAIP